MAFMKHGFTLIELLVVISIISIISSIVFNSLNNARISARDAERISEIDQINKALWLFYNKEGYMPTANSYNTGTLGKGGWDEGVYISGGEITVNPNFLKPLVDKGYLSTPPYDPLNNGHNDGGDLQGHTYSYHCYESNDTYTLRIRKESTNLSYSYIYRKPTKCRPYTP